MGNGPFSHNVFSGTPEIVPMGMSHKSGEEMKQYLDHHFQPGTYHMGDKNCNSFTDCALQFLIGHGLTIDRFERTTVGKLVMDKTFQKNPNLQAMPWLGTKQVKQQIDRDFGRRPQ